jgi:gliding motility-associated-like protein
VKNRILIALLTAACSLVLVPCACFSQLPSQIWTRNYGGSAVDVPFTIKRTIDGGTIIGGYTTSKDEMVSNDPAREYWDLWIIKLDRCGNIVWQLTLGGKGYESARDLLQTADGGFLILAETNSTDGGVVPGYGATKDIWLLKIDAAGNVQWQKRIGGSGLDLGNQLYALDDGNFLIAATTSSSDGDVSGNHSGSGYTDGWLIKIDPSGNILWSRCFGGSKNEELLDIEVIDNRIYIAGYANSIDGDIPANQKNYDMWLLCTDMQGNKISSRIYGGSQNDVAYSMTTGSNGTLTLAGYTTSNDGDVSGNRGGQDFWIINVNTNGELRWQRTFGGTDAEYANYIFTDADGGYVAGGISYSKDGDVSNTSDNGEFWLVKTDAAGNAVWTDAIGGSGNDYLRAMVFMPVEREYYITGDSESDDGDMPDNEGSTDIALVKFKLIDTITRDTMVCNPATFNMPPQILSDQCGYDSAVVNYTPVPLGSPFQGLARRDTIFAGESLTLQAATTGTVTWTPHPTLSCTACPNPTASPITTTSYSARMDIDGCSASDQFTVVVFNDAVVHLPNAFTPNGDGVNDLFGPAGKVPDAYQMQIFNRNGEIVFMGNSVNARWDGRYKGKEQPSNAFVYVISYRDMRKQLQVKKGSLMLIR